MTIAERILYFVLGVALLVTSIHSLVKVFRSVGRSGGPKP